jgi:hypothetical protein
VPGLIRGTSVGFVHVTNGLVEHVTKSVVRAFRADYDYLAWLIHHAFGIGECAKFLSRSHDAVIRVYDDAGSVIETHE